MKKSFILNIILTIVVIFLGFRYFKALNDKKDAISNINALNSKVVETKNKLGEVSHKTEILQTENTKLLENVNVKSKENKRLKTLVKKYKSEIKKGGSVTVFNDTIVIEKTTNVVKNKDTTTFGYVDKWLSLSGIVTDSLKFKLDFKNEYSLIIGEERKTLFKKVPFALITNRNPYATITTLKTYKVKNNKKKIQIGFSAGYGIFINNGVQLGPGVIAGINYNL